MKKRLVSLLGAAIVLLMAVGCSLPDQPVDTPPEGSLSYDELRADLDALQGPASRSLSAPGKSVFSLPGGASLSLQDLSAYINAIKNEFAAYVRASAGGSLYLVQAVKLSLPGSNSGLMWVPFTWGARKSFPVISYQHGTEVFRESAPSRFNANPFAVFSSPDQYGALQTYVECTVGALMASAGYIVVMPDYPGFGDSTAVHPYVQQVLGDSVKDIVVAARTVLTGKVKPNDKVYLTGYSEGGYATVAGARALQQAGIPVTATVPGDGPYDLSGVMRDQMVSGLHVPVPSYLLYTVSGYHAKYPAVVDFSALLVPEWADLLTNHNPFDGTHTGAQVGALVPSTIIPRDMLTQNAIDTLMASGGDVYNLLAANNGYVGWVPTAPLILIHCPTDDVVPYANATIIKSAFVEMGVPATLIPIVDVQPVPFIESFLGSIHAAAYPTAILAAFTAIQTVNH